MTDDTGAGVVETPETPDEDFDDMTLIGTRPSVLCLSHFPVLDRPFFFLMTLFLRQFVRYRLRQIGRLSFIIMLDRND